MVIGNERMRRPVAWNTVLVIAAGTPRLSILPIP